MGRLEPKLARQRAQRAAPARADEDLELEEREIERICHQSTCIQIGYTCLRPAGWPTCDPSATFPEGRGDPNHENDDESSRNDPISRRRPAGLCGHGRGGA